MINEVAEVIKAIGGEGEFAVEDTLSVSTRGVRVHGVGLLPASITDGWARKLIAVAHPAPFGVRDQTRYDDRIRRTWEIGAAQVQVSDTWKRALEEKLATLVRRLGFDPEGKVEAVLDKLLIYEQGDFFAPHQDSERVDGMLASLVVALPSKHTGGQIIVEHNRRKKTLGGAGGSGSPAVFAFYADCRHQVARVERGHRITLTYHLVQKRSGRAGAKPRKSSIQDRLTESLRTYFATPSRTSSGEAIPRERFVYLLDHEYTQKGLSWKTLKGEDRVRVAELAAAADRLDCRAVLALADVHESWNSDDESGDYGYGRRSYHHYDDDDDFEDDDSDDDAGGDADDYGVTDLIDSDVTLHHFVEREGPSDPGIPTGVSDDEVCFTSPSSELKPFKSEHEGYMGNYGNTVDRWYHRAAFVMWPRARTFVLRAKQSPAWAVKELSRLLAEGSTDEARRSVESLLPFWAATAGREEGVAFFKGAVRVALALEAPNLAAKLLAPFGSARLTTGTLPGLLRTLETYGLEWSKALFTAWTGAEYRRVSFLPVLPLLCEALIAPRWPDGLKLATWLLEIELAEFVKRYAQSGPTLLMRAGASTRSALVQEAVALFDGAAITTAARVRDDLVDFLTAVGVPAVVLADILKKIFEGRAPAAVRQLGLGALRAHALRETRDAVAAPPRAAGDWSITTKLDCSCALCATLTKFLNLETSVEYRWPLAKDKRQHVHNVIDRHELPVTHETIRSGSPFTLVLRKQRALFEREAARRSEQAQLLKWLEVSEPKFQPLAAAPRPRGRG